MVEPLFALLMINVGLFVSWLRAFLSCLVRLSVLLCLCLCSFMISNLILCRNVSSVPLSDSLSGLGYVCFFILNIIYILKKMKCYLAVVQLAMVLTGILSMIVQKGIGVESDL